MGVTTYNPRLRRGFFLTALWVGAAVQAAPYKPADADTNLLDIPAELSQARAAVSRPLTEQQAVTLAQVFIQRARATGDPRHLGYAQGVLAPWWTAAAPPAPVLLLRATLQQARHDFEAALSDLDQLLERQPDNAQAWLTRATVLRVLGRYPQARQACAELVGRADLFIARLCESAVRGLSGELAPAAAALDALSPQLDTQSTAVAAWFFAERFDMAVRAADGARAQALAAEISRAHPGDLGLRAAIADWHLDAGRPAPVLGLIAGDEPVDALLLRRWLALRQLDDPRAAPLQARLLQTFEAAQRRGEDIHRREEARFRLALGETARALELAQANWAEQYEPWDARLLLAAAAAEDRPQAAAAVRRWLKDSGLQDVRLARWLP